MTETATARSTDLPEFPQPDSPNFFTADQLADRWQISREKVYRIDADDLPYLKLGSRTKRYRLEDVRQFEREHLHGG